MNAFLILLAEDDKVPEANDVVAGWTGFAVFLALIAAVALLCWSLTRQLRKAQAAKDAGLYGDRPAADEAAEGEAAEGEQGEAGPADSNTDAAATPGSTQNGDRDA